MRRKILFGIDYTDNEFVKLVLYLFTGGTAALVEWALFYLLLNCLVANFPNLFISPIMLATAAAFTVSTLYHYFLGNVLVFDSGSRYGRSREIELVFLVSIAGLCFNLVLMYIFTGLLALAPLPAKIIASCIVVAWNYLSRKKWIFRS